MTRQLCPPIGASRGRTPLLFTETGQIPVSRNTTRSQGPLNQYSLTSVVVVNMYGVDNRHHAGKYSGRCLLRNASTHPHRLDILLRCISSRSTFNDVITLSRCHILQYSICTTIARGYRSTTHQYISIVCHSL